MQKLLSFLFIIIPVTLFSQNKTEEITIKDGYLLEAMYLPNCGLVLSIGESRYYYEKINKLKFYSPDLEKIWEANIDEENSHVINSNSLVGSSDGSHVYFFTKDNIVKVDKSGKVTTKEFEISSLKNRQAAFCSNNFFYILEADIPSGKFPGKMILHRFSAKGFTYKEIVISNLPELNDYKTHTFWTYIGNFNDTIYLQSKYVDKANRINKYQIAMVSSAGEAIGLTTIDCTLPEFTLPARSYEFLAGAALFWNYDLLTGGAPSSANVGETYDPTKGAFGDIRIDALNRFFYVYAFSGTKLSWVWGKSYEKLNFFKFDFDGNLIWKVSTEMDENFIEKDFRSSGPTNGLVSFRLNPDGSSIFQMFYHKVYTFELDMDGKIVQKYSVDNKFMDYSYSDKPKRLLFDGQIVFPDQSEDASYRFINSSRNNNHAAAYSLYRFRDKSLVLEEDINKRILNLHLIEE